MDKVHYIREIMQLKGITNTELAKRLGVTQQAISLQITHDLRVSKAKKIAEALEVPLSDLFKEPQLNTQQSISTTSLVRCPKCGAELELSVKHK